MTTPSSNITFGSIQTEFGGNNPILISEYLRGGSYVAANQATSGVDGSPIPTSPSNVRLGMFRGLTKTPTILGHRPAAYTINGNTTFGTTGANDGGTSDSVDTSTSQGILDNTIIYSDFTNMPLGVVSGTLKAQFNASAYLTDVGGGGAGWIAMWYSLDNGVYWNQMFFFHLNDEGENTFPNSTTTTSLVITNGALMIKAQAWSNDWSYHWCQLNIFDIVFIA